MHNKNVNRRDFLRSSMYAAAGLAGGSMIAEVAIAARDSGAEFRLLTGPQASLLEAISARLIPATDTPGAREAGVVYFYDIALSDRMADMRDPVLTGADDFAAMVEDAHGKRFEELPAATQDNVLASVEDGPFFNMVHTLTLFGFFAMEKHGGNRGHLSWKLIGFDGHTPAKYPFGYYDAEVHGARKDG